MRVRLRPTPPRTAFSTWISPDWGCGVGGGGGIVEEYSMIKSSV